MKNTNNNSENALNKDVKENASATPQPKTAEEIKQDAEAKAAEEKAAKDKADAEAKAAEEKAAKDKAGAEAKAAKKGGKIRFLISPISRFRLAYSAGDEVKVKDLGLKAEQIEELIESGTAEKI